MAKQEMEKVKPGDVGKLTTVPDYLKREQGQVAAGTEYMEQQDLTMPRLGLCQALTPQRQKADPKFIQGLEEGQFFNSVTREIYGEKLLIVPLLFYKQRIRFDKNKMGSILCQALDDKVGIGDPGGICLKCPLAQFTNDSKPECMRFFNYASLIIVNGRVAPENMLTFSLKSTGLKIAKDWNSLIRIKNIDMFGGVYEVTSVVAKDDRNSWYAPKIEPAGFVPQEVYSQAKHAYEIVAELNRQGRLKHDMSDFTESSTETTAEM